MHVSICLSLDFQFEICKPVIPTQLCILIGRQVSQNFAPSHFQTALLFHRASTPPQINLSSYGLQSISDTSASSLFTSSLGKYRSHPLLALKVILINLFSSCMPESTNWRTNQLPNLIFSRNTFMHQGDRYICGANTSTGKQLRKQFTLDYCWYN